MEHFYASREKNKFAVFATVFGRRAYEMNNLRRSINIVAVFGREQVLLESHVSCTRKEGDTGKGRGGGGETQRQHWSGPYARNAYTRVRTQRGV